MDDFGDGTDDDAADTPLERVQDDDDDNIHDVDDAASSVDGAENHHGALHDEDEPDEMDLSRLEEHAAVARSQRTDAIHESADDFLLTRQAVVRFVQDSIAHAVDRQKQQADKSGRGNTLSFNVGDLVLLSTTTLPEHAVTNLGSKKLLPRYVGPFRVLRKLGNAYTLEIPRRMRTHPTFYVGRLRPYHQYERVSSDPAVDQDDGASQGHACDQPQASDAPLRASGAPP